MLQWKPVDDPRVTDYLIEVQGYWSQMEIWGRFSSVDRITTDTSYQVDCFPASWGALDGFFNYRWRVTAHASDPGSTSAPSNWHYFSFPTPTSDVRLAPVNVISPANKIVVSAGTPLNVKWELVPGEIEWYLFFCQKLTDNKEWKMEPPHTVLSNNPTFPFPASSYTDTPGKFRFRVVAYGIVPNSYSVSAWRYFTVVWRGKWLPNIFPLFISENTKQHFTFVNFFLSSGYIAHQWRETPTEREYELKEKWKIRKRTYSGTWCIRIFLNDYLLCWNNKDWQGSGALRHVYTL